MELLLVVSVLVFMVITINPTVIITQLNNKISAIALHQGIRNIYITIDKLCLSNAEITQLGKLSINLANLPAISTVTKGGETRIATRTATGGAQVEYSTLYTALSLAALLFVAGVWVALRQREVG